jgi:photosystem II reaction center protein PsbP
VRTVLAIGLLVGALLGGGCGGGDDEEEPQNGGQPQAEETQAPQEQEQQEGAIEGTGYSFVPPEGWNDISKQFEGSAIRVDAVYAEPDPEQGFANNVNVVRETPSGLDPDRLEDYVTAFRQQAGSLATDAGLSETEEAELDGEPARSWTFESRRQEDPRVRQRQVVTIHDDGLYTITWTARHDAFEESEPELERLLDSWRWSSR